MGARRPSSKRLMIALSVVLYIALAFPIWWRTVRVPRAPLPHDHLQLLEAVHGNFSYQLPVHIALYTLCQGTETCLAGDTPTGLVKQFRETLLTLIQENEGIPLTVSLTQETQGRCTSDVGSPFAASPCLNLSALAHNGSAAELDSRLQQKLEKRNLSVPGTYHIFLLPQRDSGTPVVQTVVGVYRHACLFYAPGSSLAGPLEQAAQVAALSFAARLGAAAVRSAPALPVSPRSEALLSFSLCNAEPTADAFTWRFDSFQHRYLQPLAQSLKPVVGLSTQGQVLYYTPARTHGAWSSAQGAWLLAPQQLPFFIDSSWNLDSGRMAHAASGQSSVRNLHKSIHIQGRCPHCGGAAAEDAHCDFVAATARVGEHSRQCESQQKDEQQQHQKQQCKCHGSNAPQQQGAPHSTAHLPPHVLSFVLYVPPPRHRPLRIAAAATTAQHGAANHSTGPASSSSSSFHVFSWGGLTIVSSSLEANSAAAASSQPQQQHVITTSGVSMDDDVREEQQDLHASSGNDAAAAAAPASPNAHSQPPTLSSAQAQISGSSGSGMVMQMISDEEMQAFAGVVVEQLHALLGLDLHHHLAAMQHSNSGGSTAAAVEVLPALREGFRRWEVDVLARQRACVALTTAVSTLGSLSRLVQALPNLAVPEEVQRHVLSAVSSVDEALKAAREGKYWVAVRAASAAHAHAEAAFSSPAIMAKLNVPDTHHIGVYLPFFLPASVPLLQGLGTEVLRYFKRRKAHAIL